MNLVSGALPLLVCSVLPALGAVTPEPSRTRLGLVVAGDADVPPKLVGEARARLSAAFAEVTSALVPAPTVDKWLADAGARSGSSCKGGLVSRPCRVSLGYVLEATYLAQAHLTRTSGRCILSVRVFELTRDGPIGAFAGQGPCDDAGLTTLSRKAVVRVGRALRLPRAQGDRHPTARAGKAPAPSEPDEEPEDEGAEPTPGDGAAPDLPPAEVTPDGMPLLPDGA
jgi:hypothetical protein